MDLCPPEYTPEYLLPGWASRPWVRFWTRDWRGDPDVQRLTFEQRGMYLELILLDAEQGHTAHINLPGTSARLLGRLWPEVYLEVSRTLAQSLAKDRRKVSRIFWALAGHFVVTRCGHVLNRRAERERKRARQHREKHDTKNGRNPFENPPLPSSYTRCTSSSYLEMDGEKGKGGRRSAASGRKEEAHKGGEEEGEKKTRTFGQRGWQEGWR